MQYRFLGNSGLIVSRMTLGVMTFTQENRDFPSVQKVQLKAAGELVGKALDAGVNYFDTADVYARGESEMVLGQCLKGRRADVVISSKVGLRSGPQLGDYGLSRRHISASIDGTLKRLGTDYLDIYIAHRDDRYTPLEESLEALDAVVRAGKVRYLGFSNWSAWRVATAMKIQEANGWASFTHGQMHYSLLARDIERDVIPMMRQFGLGLTVWSPLSNGLLTGKFTRANIKDPGSRLSETGFLPLDYESGFTVVDVARGIAEKRGATVSQVALAWLLSRDSVSSIVLGVTKPSQLEENLGALGIELLDEDRAALDSATRLATVYPNWFNDSFTDPQFTKAFGPPRP